MCERTMVESDPMEGKRSKSPHHSTSPFLRQRAFCLLVYRVCSVKSDAEPDRAVAGLSQFSEDNSSFMNCVVMSGE